MQTETLRHLLTLPAVLSTQASLLMMQSSGEGLFRNLGLAGDDTDLVLANSDRVEDYVNANTNKKENRNGYL